MRAVGTSATAEQLPLARPRLLLVTAAVILAALLVFASTAGAEIFKAGKWRTVKVTVTNPGAVTSSQGSLTVKAAKGIKVKPATQTIPALAPGGTWTLPIKVQATAKARKKSTLRLTATASGLSATGSLVVKLQQ